MKIPVDAVPKNKNKNPAFGLAPGLVFYAAKDESKRGSSLAE
jgi:hypothetical protein